MKFFNYFTKTLVNIKMIDIIHIYNSRDKNYE